MIMNSKLYLVVMIAMALLSACAQLPIHFKSEPSYTITDTKDTALGKISKKELGESVNQSKMITQRWC